MNHMTKPLHQPSVVEDTIITSRLRSNLTSTSKQLSVRGLGCSMRRALVVNIPRSRRYGGRTSLCFVLFAFARAMSSSVTCISFGYTGYDCSSQSNPSAGRKQPGSAARALATPTLPPHGLGTAWLAQPCGELEGDPGRLGVPLVPAKWMFASYRQSRGLLNPPPLGQHNSESSGMAAMTRHWPGDAAVPGDVLRNGHVCPASGLVAILKLFSTSIPIA